MSCHEVMELMQRQLDGDLNAKEEEELYAHLMDCLECAEMFERLQQLSDELTMLPKVMPPYSLVDAIIPTLDQIDRQNNAPVHAAAPLQSDSRSAAQPPKIPWTRRFGSQISWKLAGGVVAAGLIIGIFTFNMKSPVMDQADGLLQPRLKSEASSSSNQGESSGSSASGAADQSDAAHDTAPAASGQQDETANRQNAVPTPTQSATPKLQVMNSLDQHKADDAASKPQSAAPKSPAAATVSPAAPSVIQVPAASNTPIEQPPEEPPIPQVTEQPSATPEEPMQRMSTMAIEESPAPSGEPSPSPAAKAAPSEEPPQVFGFAAPIVSPEPSAEAVLKSLEGNYEAVVVHQQVIIKDAVSQEAVFTSDKVWDQADHISLIAWSKDNKLTYRVTSGDKEQTFVLDVQAKTETTP